MLLLRESPELEWKGVTLIYTEADLQQMAIAVGVELAQVKRQSRQLEGAAEWYRLDSRRPIRRKPSGVQRKLRQIQQSARKLLKHLGIDDPAAADDGPGDPDIAWALAYGANQDVVQTATAQIGRLVELLDAIAAAADLEKLAGNAVDEVDENARLTVPKGHTGDDAVNGWIEAMMGVYKAITGKEPATSVGGSGQSNEGIASGPLIAFLAAAGKPLRLPFAEDALRSRVRTIKAYPSKQES